jgi:diketogulonate reductase-like aldo/keto reductase
MLRGRGRDLGGAVRAAAALGYRLFDTAEAYGSEALLGATVGGRAGVLLATKLWHTNHDPKHVVRACQASCRRLRVAAVDLYLVHGPEAWRHVGPLEIPPDSDRETLDRLLVPRDPLGAVAPSGVPLAATWEAMADVRRRGLALAIGLANVDAATIEGLVADGGELPGAVQVELHPLQPQTELQRFCAPRGIAVLAHSPFGGGSVLEHPKVVAAARSVGQTPAALVLGWHRQLGTVPLPSSDDPGKLAANLAAAAGPPPPAEALAALDALALPALP